MSTFHTASGGAAMSFVDDIEGILEYYSLDAGLCSLACQRE